MPKIVISAKPIPIWLDTSPYACLLGPTPSSQSFRTTCRDLQTTVYNGDWETQHDQEANSDINWRAIQSSPSCRPFPLWASHPSIFQLLPQHNLCSPSLSDSSSTLSEFATSYDIGYNNCYIKFYGCRFKVVRYTPWQSTFYRVWQDYGQSLNQKVKEGRW